MNGYFPRAPGNGKQNRINNADYDYYNCRNGEKNHDKSSQNRSRRGGIKQFIPCGMAGDGGVRRIFIYSLLNVNPRLA